MKNRKLFAILTLVAFMMTLLPVAAFAAPNRYASKVTVEDATVDADGETYAEFTVYLLDDSNNPVTGTVYLASSRAGTDTFVNENETALTSVATNVYSLDVTNGEADFKVKSSVAGTAKIAVGLAAPGGINPSTSVYDYLIGAGDATSASVELITTVDLTFETTSLDAVKYDAIKASDGSVTGAGTSADPYVSSDVVANGLDYYEVTFKVADKSGAGIDGEEITFSVDKSGATLNKYTATTDSLGKAKVKIYSNKNGTFALEAKAGDESKTVYVKFNAGNAFDIELTSDDNQLIAKAQKDKEFKFKVKDVQGNWIKYTTDTAADNDVDVDVVSEPTDSDIKGDITIVKNSDGYAVLKVAKFTEEGSYKLRATLANGKYAEFAFEVKKQGDVVKIELEYDEASVALGASTAAPTVKRIDADGVSLDVANVTSDIDFFVSDPKMGAVSDSGVFTATTDDDYIGEVVITAVDKVEDKTATATLTVGDEVKAILLEAPASTVPGETASVKIKTVDRNGNVVALGTAADPVATYYKLSKPSGAVLTIEDGTDFAKNLKEKGEATVDVTSSKAGDAKIQVVLDTNNDGTGDFTAAVTVKFAEAAPVVEVGAKNVTMFIGSTGYVQDGSAKVMDQAPFIQDGRTFVPVRMVGEALGAEVEYDAATQVITLTRPDMTITMTVGSNVLVKSDGTSIVSDVAPFIVVETGRTVIPFRAIAEAFGATVEAVFAADGTVTAVTFAQ